MVDNTIMELCANNVENLNYLVFMRILEQCLSVLGHNFFFN